MTTKKPAPTKMLTVRIGDDDLTKLDALRRYAPTAEIPNRSEIVLRLIREAYEAGPAQIRRDVNVETVAPGVKPAKVKR
jgi:hypothetical protein